MCHQGWQDRRMMANLRTQNISKFSAFFFSNFHLKWQWGRQTTRCVLQVLPWANWTKWTAVSFFPQEQNKSMSVHLHELCLFLEVPFVDVSQLLMLCSLLLRWIGSECHQNKIKTTICRWRKNRKCAFEGKWKKHKPARMWRKGQKQEDKIVVGVCRQKRKKKGKKRWTKPTNQLKKKKKKRKKVFSIRIDKCKTGVSWHLHLHAHAKEKTSQTEKEKWNKKTFSTMQQILLQMLKSKMLQQDRDIARSRPVLRDSEWVSLFGLEPTTCATLICRWNRIDQLIRRH